MFFDALINQCVRHYQAKYAVQDQLNVQVLCYEDVPPCVKGLSGRIVCTSRNANLESIQWEIRYVHRVPNQPQHNQMLYLPEWLFYHRLMPVFDRKRPVAGMVPLCCLRVDQTMIGLMLCLPDDFIRVQLPGHLDYPHLSLMAITIGEFHSYSFRLTVPQVEALSEGLRSYEPHLSCAELVMPTLRRCMDALIASGYLAECENVLGFMRLFNMVHKLDEEMRFLAETPSRYSVFSHQNYSREQVMFWYAEGKPEEMLIVNWKTVGWTSLGVDLATLLFVECNGEVRAEEMRSLLDDYYEALLNIFNTCHSLPTWPEMIFEIQRCIPVALCILGMRNSHPSGLWSDAFIIEVYTYLIDTYFI